jgi:hypothetical protein
MTVSSAVFWIYLAAYGFMGGIPALALGLVARFTARPFDSSRRFRLFLSLLTIAALIGIVASVLSYNLATEAGAPASFRVNSLIGSFLTDAVIFVLASGFPLSRVLSGRR